jgi:hypothetical protein
MHIAGSGSWHRPLRLARDQRGWTSANHGTPAPAERQLAEMRAAIVARFRAGLNKTLGQPT